jgi:hypothetical protein
MPEAPQPDSSRSFVRSFVRSSAVGFESIDGRERKGKERKGKERKRERSTGRVGIARAHPAPSANAFETAFATSLRPPPSIAVAVAATATRVIMM